MSPLHLLSIIIELIICVLGLRMVFEKRRYTGLCVAITFGIYVFYDLAKGLGWGMPASFMDTIFFMATGSAFFLVWRLWTKKN